MSASALRDQREPEIEEPQGRAGAEEVRPDRREVEEVQEQQEPAPRGCEGRRRVF